MDKMTSFRLGIIELDLPEYENDEAAIAGGLVVGQVYMTPDAKIKIVQDGN